ncbi:2-c-methyl-d-erythritol 4-phosphate cytidylyltransferase-like protein [Plakobranchus ocellatus]|uniref:2-C-methyl-D-erythritol 4-phosphate cytidylyltransferase, chloroplastic n=1 Tax=Plakobranchus ocellatus TaxID=259542 RepID=A0AAV3Y2W4_9GAST|nr:2-c-methyl-d-erythritol 4-phosphate cytidylyltransferase-like protein [Plakobranchus ocellatus]
MTTNMKADVVIPAAGSSVRMKMPIAKQFQEVCGHPILSYTVDCFHRLPWIRHIVVAVDSSQTEHTRSIVEKYGFEKVMICEGGHTRHRSICSAVQALRDACEDDDVVLIHDAARPFVSEEIISKVVSAAQRHKAAGVTRPLVSTVIQGDEHGQLVESLDRQVYRNSEMPQAFHYGVIAKAYSNCTKYDLDFGTECLLLALKYCSCSACLVEGTDDLWKVTYQKDLYTMESVVKEKFTTLWFAQGMETTSALPAEVENKILRWPFQVVTSENSPANTFITFVELKQISQSFTNFAWLAAQVARSCSNQNFSSRVRLKPFVLLVFTLDTNHEGKSDVGHRVDGKEWRSHEKSMLGKTSNCISESTSHQDLSNNTKERSHSIVTDAEDHSLVSNASDLSPLSSQVSPPNRKYLKLSASSASSQSENNHRTNMPGDAASRDRLGQRRDAASDDRLGQRGESNHYNQCGGEGCKSEPGQKQLTFDLCSTALTRAKACLRQAFKKVPFTIVGITSEVSPHLADRLLDLVWHRAAYLDSQLLDWA